MSGGDERLLIERARRDPAAFAALYDAYFPRVYAYVRQRVGCRQDAEDVVADVFLRAVAAIGDFAPRHEASFAGWLFRIAHNRLANFYRARDGRASLSLEAAAAWPAGDPAPDEFVLRDEVIAALHAGLRALPPRRREIIALRFFGELRNREIAAVLGLDERTVSAHVSRGLLELGRRFREADERAGEEAGCAPTSER